MNQQEYGNSSNEQITILFVQALVEYYRGDKEFARRNLDLAVHKVETGNFSPLNVIPLFKNQ